MSKLQSNHEKDHRYLGADEIKDQDKHFVGAAGEAAFQSPWAGDVWYGMDVGRHTRIEGMPTGGTTGGTVFFLPTDYRPPEDVEDFSRGENLGDIAFWKVQASDGAVIYEGSGNVVVT